MLPNLGLVALTLTGGEVLLTYLQTLSLITPPICTEGRFAKTEIHVLANQPIFQVQQNSRIFRINHAI